MWKVYVFGVYKISIQNLDQCSALHDTLKAFDDFENKQVYQVTFLICKSIYILKVYSIHYNT